jgi:hypothetical protein
LNLLDGHRDSAAKHEVSPLSALQVTRNQMMYRSQDRQLDYVQNSKLFTVEAIFGRLLSSEYVSLLETLSSSLEKTMLDK